MSSRRANRKRKSRRRRNGRRYRRNFSFFKGLFRRNPSGLIGLALVAVGGWVAGRALANTVSMVVAKLGAAAPAAAPASPAVQGLGNVALNYAGVIGSLVAAGVQIPLTMKFVEDPATRQALVTGAVVSLFHGLVKGLLPKSFSDFLSGDDTAAKLSAMYGVRGLGQGTSIMPHYQPITGYGEYLAAQNGMGMGEYFSTPMGEYFSTPMQGMGEYFESGVQGLGNYTQNPELYQAAAGYGEVMTGNTNHIDPGSNLDRELSIAEAAAGIGTAYEAAAGYRGYGALPPYEAQAGLGGGIETVPTASTWIPGTTNGQLWAGVRAVDRSQEETAETPAGVLSTPGGSGILG